MKAVENCKSLRALFAKQERWVKGYWHAWRDEKNIVYGYEPSFGRFAMHCFCLDGGLQQVYGESGPKLDAARKRLAKAIVKLGFCKKLKGPWESKIVNFNDSRQTKWEHIKAVIHAAHV